MMVVRKILLVALLLAGFTSCEKSIFKRKLPDKTQDGRNTLGFLYNNEVWVNEGEICNWFDCKENEVIGRLHTYRDQTKGVIIEAHYNNKKRKIWQQISISAKNVTGEGTYYLGSHHDEMMGFVTDWSKNMFYSLRAGSRARLVITRLDTVNHIISGEFSGLLYQHQDSTQVADIKDGRFDTRLTYTNG